MRLYMSNIDYAFHMLMSFLCSCASTDYDKKYFNIDIYQVVDNVRLKN